MGVLRRGAIRWRLSLEGQCGRLRERMLEQEADTMAVTWASCTDVVLARLGARTEGVRLCEVVQAVENATAGVLDRATTADILARVLQAGRVVRRGRVEMGNERRVWRPQ